jgi:hypothetical protein
VVTAILADFRSLDTLGEVVVIVTAGLAVVLVVRSGAAQPPGGAAGNVTPGWPKAGAPKRGDKRKGSS